MGPSSDLCRSVPGRSLDGGVILDGLAIIEGNSAELLAIGSEGHAMRRSGRRLQLAVLRWLRRVRRRR